MGGLWLWWIGLWLMAEFFSSTHHRLFEAEVPDGVPLVVLGSSHFLRVAEGRYAELNDRQIATLPGTVKDRREDVDETVHDDGENNRHVAATRDHARYW